MRIPRLLIRQALQANISLLLASADADYLVKVLRLTPGEKIIITDGAGTLAHAHLDTVQKRQVIVYIDDIYQENRESPLYLKLWQCVSKGDRMDYTLQKAIELGVSDIVPVQSERVNVHLDAERLAKRYHHWQGVIDSAAMQTGRSTVPIIQPLQTLAALTSLPAEPNRLRIVLDPLATQTLQTLTPAKQVDILVGSEGGFSANELAQVKQAGFIGIKLGPRILRTETAAVVLLSLLQGMWGDLNR